MRSTYKYSYWNADFGPSFLEQRVDALARQVEIEVNLYDAQLLLAGGQYEGHVGIGSGAHYRKARQQGCYHLRIDGQRAFMHWDEWDPRRHPIEHFFETPLLWGSALALVIGGLFAASRDANRDE